MIFDVISKLRDITLQAEDMASAKTLRQKLSIFKKHQGSWAPEAHAYNPSYLGG
jgi:hypothetical protein